MTQLLLSPDDLADLLEHGEVVAQMYGNTPDKGQVLYIGEKWKTEVVSGWQMLLVRDQTYKMIGLPQAMWDHAHRGDGKWRSAKQMPSWAARLWVKVEGVESHQNCDFATMKLTDPPEFRVEKVVRKYKRRKNVSKNIINEITKPCQS